MQELKIKSFDGKEIFVTIWDDVENPKAVIQLEHGMEECGGFYEEFALYLNSRGYIVFADDHRAHGRTETDEDRGHAKGNLYEDTLKDLVFFRNWLKEKYSLPVFMFGHSYGSFLLQSFLQEGTDVQAVVLTGTGYCKTRNILRCIGLFPMWLVARNSRPKFVNFLSDHFRRCKGDKGPIQWINSLEWRRNDFVNGKWGKYNHIDMSMNFDFYATYGPIKSYKKENLAKLNKGTAVGLFSGKDDKNAEHGKSIEKLNNMYLKYGLKSEMHLYEGSRHDVIFDREAERVQKEIADFYDKCLLN